MKEIRKTIEGVTLTTKQSTSIMAEILETYGELTDSWRYSAPEVVELGMKEFLWDVYVGGRVDEKEDILKAVTPKR